MGIGRRARKITKRLRKTRVVFFLEYLFLRIVFWSLSVIPYSTSIRIGAFLGRIIYWLDPAHRHIAEVNIRYALPEINEERVRLIARKSFEHLGKMVSEFAQLTRMDIKDIRNRVRFEGFEIYERITSNGKGALGLTGHIGNWEMLAVVQSSLGYQIGFVARSIDNPYIDRFVNNIRLRHGATVFRKKTPLKGMVDFLRNGGAVGVLFDHHISVKKGGIVVDFFGYPAETSTILPRLALKLHLPIIPVFCLREKDNQGFLIKFLEPVSLIRTGDMEKDIVENTIRCNRVLEDVIRQYPEQWFWIHRRWKNYFRSKGIKY